MLFRSVGVVQFSSSQSSGLPLDVFYSSAGSPGIVNPGLAYPAYNNYILDMNDSYIKLNTFHDWHKDGTHNLDLNDFDVETILLHEAGHIHGLAHPLTNSYTHDASAPIMAGGDNVYFHNNVARSLRNDDINGKKWLGANAMVPEHYSSISEACSNVASGGTIFVSSNTYNENSFLIPNNKTVKIEPGTIIIFSENSNLGVEGILYAKGTSTNPIIFKSNTGTWNGIHVFDNGDFIKNEYCQIQNLPLSVTITSIGNNQYKANASGGSENYTSYKWWSRKDDGIVPKGETKAPPPGQWIYNPSWDDLSIITCSVYWAFSLKCEVRDSDGNTATDIYSEPADKNHPYYSQKKSVKVSNIKPKIISLNDNSPNPFNPTTKIRFGVPNTQRVTINVYSIKGKKIRTLMKETVDAGYYSIDWDATNDFGEKVSSGLYIYRMKTNSKVITKKMLFTK